MSKLKKNIFLNLDCSNCGNCFQPFSFFKFHLPSLLTYSTIVLALVEHILCDTSTAFLLSWQFFSLTPSMQTIYKEKYC